MTFGIALYGTNAHQIQGLLRDYPGIRLVAVAEFPPERLPADLPGRDQVRFCQNLEELLADGSIDLISLCSPRRSEQPEHAIRCLRAGKHVYAEKPCALNEPELDSILSAATASGRKFREMAGSAFEQPYLEMRRLVAAGEIGEVVQVFAQKSYPYHDGRPRDEAVDGGLLRQVGIHALRFIEHVCGLRISEITARETPWGNPGPGRLHMAASYMMKLENGALAVAIANYLNPKGGFGQWGNEHLRIFGTKGFVESTDAGQRTRLVLNDRDCGPLKLEPARDYFHLYLDELLGRGPAPQDSETELHPTRMVIRAKLTAQPQS